MDSRFAMIAAAAIVFASAFTYLLAWVARLVAPRIGFVDRPDGGRKQHAHSTPLLGGVAVFAGFALAVLITVPHVTGRSPGTMLTARTLISGCLFCLLGALDDKFSFRPRTKFLGQIAASIPFLIGMEPFECVELLGIRLHLGVFSPVFMVFWLVACTNIVNLIDGLDGLAGTVGFVATLTIAVLSLISENTAVAFLSLVLTGSIVGFLFHNWPPARIFLGDAGSLTIGFLAGALSMEASQKTAAVFTLTVPAVLLSIPAFDTLMAILRRRLHGRGIGEADRGHIHHRLQDRGLSKLQTLLAIGGLCLIMAGAAVLAAYCENDLFAAVACVLVFSIVIATRWFGYHETLMVFRHAQALQELFRDSVALVGTRFLLARTASGDEQLRRKLWSEACDRLARVGCTSLEVSRRVGPADAPETMRRWNSEFSVEDDGAVWSMRYEIQRDDGWWLSVVGEGRIAESQRLPRSDDLFQIFHGLCRYFPTDQEDREFADVIPFTRPQPDQERHSDFPKRAPAHAPPKRRAA